MAGRVVAAIMVLAGLGLVIGWCVLLLPTLSIAEAEARLDFRERLVVVAPMATASALLVGGGELGRYAERDTTTPRGRSVFQAAVVAGVLAGVAALGVLLVWPQ